MKIILDAMGGDNAPLAAVTGAAMAAQAFKEEIILVGDQDTINGILRERRWDGALPGGKLTVVHAPDVVDMHDDPATVLRHKPESSMAVALKMLKKGEGDAVVSAGNTGALLSGATLYGGRIKGIRRAALAPMMPCRGGQVMLVDAGANTECTPEYLLQFAFMGSLYMERMAGLKKPRVGLVNNGTEDTKGDPLRRETYALLRAAGDAGRINFVGNVEGSGVAFGECDVAVCDGFAGNILLKTLEGVAKFMGGEIKQVFLHSLMTKLGYLACKKGMDAFQEQFNQDKIGGAPFLGVARPVIKAHGSSNETAFMNAVRQAIAYTQSGMIEAVQQNIEYMTVGKAE
ncbi:phosphate acyltransferase PlsX [Intestinibacillus massiliensis]|uniref:phosphate acyltransferase PlsX n=1 Tax=Intestinibacillus massiliensis TaxID=1871029 RepID=UPI000B34D69D|nr:phosphate acyltransferase PlsX [Intestinibacillus massiliensis]